MGSGACRLGNSLMVQFDLCVNDQETFSTGFRINDDR